MTSTARKIPGLLPQVSARITVSTPQKSSFTSGLSTATSSISTLSNSTKLFGVKYSLIVLVRHANLHCAVDLKIKPFWFVVELFCVLENGRKRNLTIARFTQTKGAASSFRKVADIAEDVFRSKGMLVEDEAKEKEMIRILKVRN